MPATNQDSTVYISTGNPETFYNQTSLYKPGELGKRFTALTGKRYQIVQVDSAASGTASSVANGLLYWTNQAAYKVTPVCTDVLNLAVINGVAGRSPNITAPGNYTAMQIAGTAVLVYGGTTTAGVVGSSVMGKATTLSDANAVAANSAPTNKVVGWVTVAGTTNAITCNLVLDDEEVG